MPIWLVSLCLFLTSSLATYRLLSLPDLCKASHAQPSPPVVLGDGGAAVLYLGNSEGLPHWRCDLEIHAETGYGLMVHVEEANLRPSMIREGKCQDYVQLGRDDKTPFYTWDKTSRLCGETAAGATYDVPNGKLLVWARLGGSHGLEKVLLSLVVTAYLREEDSDLLTHYRACNDGGRYIRRGFFCDGRVNCAADNITNPADESSSSCGNGISSSNPPPPSPLPPLNLLTITLVLVSITIILLTLCILTFRISRREQGCCFSPSTSSTPELPDRHAPSQGLLHPPPQARPHTLLHSSYTAPVQVPIRSTTPDSDSEPPPAYRDLYPTGFIFDQEKIDQSHGDVLNGSLQELGVAGVSHLSDSLEINSLESCDLVERQAERSSDPDCQEPMNPQGRSQPDACETLERNEHRITIV